MKYLPEKHITISS